MARLPREFASWIVLPVLLVGTVGGFFLYERAMRVEEARPLLDATDRLIAEMHEQGNGRIRQERMLMQLRTVPRDRQRDALGMLMVEAVDSGDADRVRLLLPMLPQDLRLAGAPHLAIAIGRGDVEMVRALLEGGVPVLPPERMPGSKPRPMSSREAAVSGHYGTTRHPLLDAISVRSVDIVRLLVAWGADPDVSLKMTPSDVQSVLRESARRMRHIRSGGGGALPVGAGGPPAGVPVSAVSPPPPSAAGGTVSPAPPSGAAPTVSPRPPSAPAPGGAFANSGAPARGGYGAFSSTPKLTVTITPRELARRTGDESLIRAFPSRRTAKASTGSISSTAGE